MPELPEVEVIRRGLMSVLPGQAIQDFTVLEPRSFPDFNALVAAYLQHSQVLSVGRRGKLLLIGLQPQDAGSAAADRSPQAPSSASPAHPAGDPALATPLTGILSPLPIAADRVLLIHLRMTGQLVYRPAVPPADPGLAGGYPSSTWVGELPNRATRIIIDFADGSHLYFNDQRKFGYMKLVAATELAEESFLAQLGPEPLDSDFSCEQLRQALQGAAAHSGTGNIKAALLDQHKLAGIGNIYADESLFRAHLDPRRSVGDLSAEDWQLLFAGVQECLQQSLADGGSTARNYVDARGLRGEFLDLHAAVYGREGQPCPCCGQPISKIRVAGRGTHLCTNCQH